MKMKLERDSKNSESLEIIVLYSYVANLTVKAFVM